MRPRLASVLRRAFVAAAFAVCAGCAGHSSEPGSVTIAGSTALLPLVKEAAADYQALHPNAKISVSGGGSFVGITQVAQHGVDIGDSDIPAAGEPALVEHDVAAVTFAIIANPAAGVRNLTKAQIADIFSGAVTNWKDVGGNDRPIAIINRPRSSGTRYVFVRRLMNGVQPTDAGLTQDSTGTVAEIVAQTPAAISYVASSYVKHGLDVPLSIDGIAPTDANVRNGSYPFWSYERMFTAGKPSAAAMRFIDFVAKDTHALELLGFLPVSEVENRAKP